MGKRSFGTFERSPKDFYRTPVEAVRPLLHHLSPQSQFIEPCAGDGALIEHLSDAGHVCRAACDIEPRPYSTTHIAKLDALEFQRPAAIPYRSYTFITNPPWSRPILHRLIEHLSDQHPTWLLFDADWIQTRQAAPFLPRLRRIVAVGRVKWIEGSPFTGKDNCAWHLFTRPSHEPPTFYGRTL